MGLRPARGRVFRAPVAGPQRATRAALCGLPGAVDSPKIVNRATQSVWAGFSPPPFLPLSRPRQGSPPAGAALAASAPMRCSPPALTRPGREICPAGLTSARFRGMLVRRCPFRSFGGRPSRGVRGRRKSRLVLSTRRLFSCSGLPSSHAENPTLANAPAACNYLIPVRQSAERNKTSVILLRSLGPKINRPMRGPSEPLRCPLATFGGFGLVLALNKIMVLCRSARCSHLPST